MSQLTYAKARTPGPDDIYADRDHEGQGEHFMRHLDRMTVEGLHSKSAIAGELAHRDAEIERILSASRYTADLCTQALDTVREQAAIIAAHEAAKQPPEGWKLVPVAPDANMIRAGDRAWLDLPRHECPTIHIHRAMLAAAPDQP